MAFNAQISDQSGSDPTNKFGSPASVGITLTGAGTLALNATNTFTRGVKIQGGKLLLAAAGAAGTGAISFTSAGTLAIDPGAAPSGAVTAYASDTLELGAGALVGTLTGVGTQFTNFGTMTVDAGASWALIGSETLTAGGLLSVAGTLTSGAGEVVINGSVTNTGTISETGVGVQLNSGGTIRNSGHLLSSTYYGALLSNGGVVNNVGGVISGLVGVRGRYGASTVNNTGTITGTGGTSVRLNLFQTNRVIDHAGAVFNGVVNGGNTGVYLSNSTLELAADSSAGTVGYLGTSFVNFGHVVVDAGASWAMAGSNTLAPGETLQVAGTLTGNVAISGGTVSNTGTIAGAGYGIELASSTLLSNAGSIQSVTNFGVDLANGGVVNNAGGVISGLVGVRGRYGASTVNNTGTITGTGGTSVRLNLFQTNRVIDHAGAVFNGVVNGGNTGVYAYKSTLELAAGTGTLSGLGSRYINFGRITIDAGANWSLTGGNTLAGGSVLTNSGTLSLLNASLNDLGGMVNNGNILIDPSSVTIASLTGFGNTTIMANSTLDVTGTVSSGETIVFASSSGVLAIDPAQFAGVIGAFGAGDTIDLAGLTAATSATLVNGNTLHVLQTTGPNFDLSLVNPATSTFNTTPNGVITAGAAPCFLRDTKIRTDTGEVMVQNLAAGDRVVTLSGAVRPITWIGSGKVLVSPGKRSAATPVIVRTGALADAVPYYDLRITKGHSLFVDGVLIPAEFLVNNRTIVWDDHKKEVEFYHIELETHDVLIANGAPSESYRDDGNRWLFRNANSGWDQPPKPACAPVLTGGPVVDAVWRRLLDRAGPRPGMPTTSDPDLHLVVDGVRLDAAVRSGVNYVFRLTRRPGSVRMMSRAGVPAEFGLSRDPRSLGVAVKQIAVWQRKQVRILDLADDDPIDGFHTFERGDDIRWTDGDAALPPTLFDGFEGALDLEVRIGGQTRYPRLVDDLIRQEA